MIATEGSKTDVIVVGGGPAGASTAFHLARRGVRVAVVDRARFPRSKPCAECLSPQASRVLADMGALSQLEHRGVWLRGMIVRAPSGAVARGDYAADHGFRAWRDAGLSIRREMLDDVLIARARAVGAHVVEETRVTDVIRDGRGAVCGARLHDREGTSRVVGAQLVIGADGLRSVIARRLRLWRRARWPNRISLVGHYEGVRDVTDYGEMHVEHDGFVGIADVGAGITTVAAVFPDSRAREISKNRSEFLDAWLASKSHLRGRFAGARRIEPAAAVGPFAAHATRAWHPGALLVGDAADFFDPFTGEGIYAALRGGELAADAIMNALLHPGDATESLREYEAQRRGEFGGKWLVERIIGAAVAFPVVVNRAARAMAARKELADLLVGVTGDFVPPRMVLRLGFLARMFLQPISRTSTIHARHA
jgi:geranylgeranyl reductase family protein